MRLVAMHAGSCNLNERRNIAFDRSRQWIHVRAWSNQIVRKSAVGIATDERAVGAKIVLALAAIEAHAAVNGRIDDDASACWQLGVSAFHHFADHFMAHDQRVANGDCAFVNVQIGPADAAMRDAHENFVVSESRALHFRQGQFSRPLQDHGFHEGFLRQSVMS